MRLKEIWRREEKRKSGEWEEEDKEEEERRAEKTYYNDAFMTSSFNRRVRWKVLKPLVDSVHLRRSQRSMW